MNADSHDMTWHLVTHSVFAAALAWPALAGAGPVLIPQTGGDSCAARIREATSSDVLQREKNPLLGAPEEPNNAPGPGSLRVLVRPDSLRHPILYIVETTTGERRPLGPGSQPRFSPDGRWIAFTRWLSLERPWILALIEVPTGRTSILERVGCIRDYAWSPDSKRIAFVSSPSATSLRWDIGWMNIDDKSPHVLASYTESHVDYSDCEWAPDSRRFLIRRQREDEHDESLFASDLWLLDLEGNACRLTHTPGRGKESPGWIDNLHIGYSDSDWKAPDGDPRQHVIELNGISAPAR